MVSSIAGGLNHWAQAEGSGGDLEGGSMHGHGKTWRQGQEVQGELDPTISPPAETADLKQSGFDQPSPKQKHPPPAPPPPTQPVPRKLLRISKHVPRSPLTLVWKLFWRKVCQMNTTPEGAGVWGLILWDLGWTDSWRTHILDLTVMLSRQTSLMVPRCSDGVLTMMMEEKCSYNNHRYVTVMEAEIITLPVRDYPQRCYCWRYFAAASPTSLLCVLPIHTSSFMIV